MTADCGQAVTEVSGRQGCGPEVAEGAINPEEPQKSDLLRNHSRSLLCVHVRRPRWCSLKCSVNLLSDSAAPWGGSGRYAGLTLFQPAVTSLSCFCCLTIGCPVLSFATRRPSPYSFQSHHLGHLIVSASW